MSWCEQQPKAVGLANLTSKILCERHNNKLGEEVDPIAAEATMIIKETMRLQEVRKNFRCSSHRVVSFRLDGCIFERWFLKTLINFTEKKPLNIRSGTRKSRIPAEELVRIAFAISPFRGEAGLWLATSPGTRDIERRIHFNSFDDGESIVGAFMYFCGHQFYLNLETSRPNFPEFQGRMTMRHPNAFVWRTQDRKNRPVKSHEILFDWKKCA